MLPLTRVCLLRSAGTATNWPTRSSRSLSTVVLRRLKSLLPRLLLWLRPRPSLQSPLPARRKQGVPKSRREWAGASSCSPGVAVASCPSAGRNASSTRSWLAQAATKSGSYINSVVPDNDEDVFWRMVSLCWSPSLYHEPSVYSLVVLRFLETLSSSAMLFLTPWDKTKLVRSVWPALFNTPRLNLTSTVQPLNIKKYILRQ